MQQPTGVRQSIRDRGALAAALDLHRGACLTLPRRPHPLGPACVRGRPCTQDAHVGLEGGPTGQRGLTIGVQS